MRPIATLIATLIATSSANAFITNISGTIDSVTARSSLAPSVLVGGTASGSFTASLDNVGPFLNSGALMISYQQDFAGAGGYTNTYSNVIYNLSSADGGGLVDSNYNGTGTWFTVFSLSYAYSNTSWSTAKSAPSAVRNTNGLYAPDGSVTLESGIASCVGSCALFPLSAFGIEGITLGLNVDQNNGFKVLGGHIIIQEIVGSGSETVHYTTLGTINSQVVPIPAAVWLMGSGLLGLMGIRRRRQCLLQSW